MSQTTETTDDATRKEKTDVGGLSPEMASVLAYLLAPLSSIIVFVMEKEDEFTRFHAMQSLIFGVISWVIITITSAFLIGVLLIPIYYLFILFLAYKAYSGEEWEIPGIGSFARDQI